MQVPLHAVRPCRTRSWALLAAFAAMLALAGCGGGADSGAEARDTAANPPAMRAARDVVAGSVPAEQPGLVGQPLQIADQFESSSVRWLTVGRLRGGGYAVAWCVQDATWSLWVQGYGPDGQRQGEKRLLLSGSTAPAIDFQDLSAIVRRDGSVVVAYVVRTDADELPGPPYIHEVRTRHFGLDGSLLGDEHVIQSVVVTGIPGTSFYRGALQKTQLAQWADGRYLVTWNVVDMVPHGGEHPRYGMRRVDASGAPAPTVYSAGPWYEPSLQVTTLGDGSWLTSSPFPATPSSLQTMRALIRQYEPRHPLALPESATLPFQSFLLGLAHGDTLLFSGDFGPGPYELVSPYTQWYNPAGKPAGGRASSPGRPLLAVALDDSSYVALFIFYDGITEGQRFDKHGRPMGSRFFAEGVAGDGLENGGMVLANSPDGRYVITRRFLPARDTSAGT